METSIVRLEITGLHGSERISIPIKDNIVLLIGINGLGKTTVMNIFYFLISKQWQRLNDIDFQTVLLETTGDPIRLDHADISDYLAWRERRSRTSPATLRALDILVERDLVNEFISSRADELHRFELLLKATERGLTRIQTEVRHMYNLMPTKTSAIRHAITLLDTIIGSNHILYLPTYRRIEKDIKNIIPDFEQLIQYRSQPRELLGRRTKAYAELTEFGMKDIEKRLADTLIELNDNNRKEFNALAGSYLSDVIRGQGSTYNLAEISELQGDVFQSIIARVEENALNEADKQLLSAAIERLRENKPNIDDPYVAHFLSKLTVLATKLAEREKPITDLVAVCNAYLENKKFVYDAKAYRVAVQNSRGKDIKLQDLSSGEKQIVSIFANLFLGDWKEYIIIIDEPELSLSMTWQTTLLPDIVSSRKCSFLFAVTHSPFVSENFLDTYVTDMRDCLGQ